MSEQKRLVVSCNQQQTFIFFIEQIVEIKTKYYAI